MTPIVVVTGIGAVTPTGTGRREVWKNLLSGRLGFAPVESFDTSQFKVQVGAEVREFEASDWLLRLDPETIGRASQLAVASAHMALDDAALDSSELVPERVGVSMGTTSGEPREIEHLDDAWIAGDLAELGAGFSDRYPCHRIPAYVAAELGVSGINTMIPAACAAGNYAIAHALDALRLGRADVMLAGGADSFSRITYTGFARLGAIAPEICQPFDRERQGMIPGEGAALLVLETLERAKRRGARIYAEVAGYGLSCDAHHMTGSHPEGDGAARAMTQALEESRLGPSDIHYISAHGTGTASNDRIETLAVKRVFGEAAFNTPMSSVKSMIGHTMGAASAIESAVCALSVAHDCVPPTMNLREPDPECDLDYVCEGSRKIHVGAAMNNAYAFGGNNASLVFKKVEVA